MNWKNGLFVLVVLLLSLGSVMGQGSAIESDRFRESLSPQGPVSDWAELLSPEQKAELNSRMEALKASNGAELAVVTVKSLQGGEIDDFAQKLFAQWGIGQKGKDNGVLLLIAVEDRKVRIEVGYGMEGVLPDAKTGRIQDEYIVPRFKEGNYAQGLIDGAAALLTVMGGTELPEPAPTENNPVAAVLFLIFFIVIFFLVVRSAIRGNHGGGFGSSSGGGSRSGGGGFGGFSGGSSGGGGSSRSW